jgi:hypothetical protein
MDWKDLVVTVIGGAMTLAVLKVVTSASIKLVDKFKKK